MRFDTELAPRPRYTTQRGNRTRKRVARLARRFLAKGVETRKLRRTIAEKLGVSTSCVHNYLREMTQQQSEGTLMRAAVRRAIEMKRAREAKRSDRPAELRRALVQAEAERERYARAIGLGGPLETLVAKLTECEQREKTLRAELARLTVRVLPDKSSAERLERTYTERLARWRELLAAAPERARDAMRALMPADQPILLTPAKDGGYRLRGATKLGALLFADGASLGSTKVASPRGDAAYP